MRSIDAFRQDLPLFALARTIFEYNTCEESRRCSQGVRLEKLLEGKARRLLPRHLSSLTRSNCNYSAPRLRLLCKSAVHRIYRASHHGSVIRSQEYHHLRNLKKTGANNQKRKGDKGERGRDKPELQSKYACAAKVRVPAAVSVLQFSSVCLATTTQM